MRKAASWTVVGGRRL